MTASKPPRADSTTVACPTCQAHPGERCTQPTDTGRRPVDWNHDARYDRLMGWGEDR